MFYFEGARKPDFSNIRSIDYDRYWEKRGFSLNGSLKEREKIILDWIPAGAKVADFGCGNSLLPLKLKEKGCVVFVGDISEAVLRGHREYGIEAKKINLENIKTEDFSEKFGYIVMSEVLEHTRNPEDIIRVLSPHTDCFALTIPNSAFYRFRLHLFFSGRFFTQWVHHPSEHIRFWSHTDFLDWLDALGLEVIKTESSNGFSFFGLFPSAKNIWKNLFGHQIAYLCRVRPVK